MTDPEEKIKKEPVPDNSGEGDAEEAEGKSGEDSAKMDEGVQDGAADVAGQVDEDDDEESEDLLKLEMSDDLKKALEEAEAHVEKGGQEDSDDIISEDVEIETETEEKDFDPNAVDEIEDEVPTPPSPREVELKMQILDLQNKLRDKDGEIEGKVKELKQNLDQARHIQKQFDGYKVRVQREKADWFNYGHEPLLKELLVVIDNLERALEHAEGAQGSAGIDTLKEGVELTLRLFLGVMEKFGVTAEDPMGKEFNPEFHQAMSRKEDDSVPNNTVVEVHQKGYMLKDRLLRAAMVVVSHREETKSEQTGDSGPEENEAPADEDTGPGPEPGDENGHSGDNGEE